MTPLSMEFSSKNTEVGSHSLLQGIFPTRGLNSHIAVRSNTIWATRSLLKLHFLNNSHWPSNNVFLNYVELFQSTNSLKYICIYCLIFAFKSLKFYFGKINTLKAVSHVKFSLMCNLIKWSTYMCFYSFFFITSSKNLANCI